MSRLETIFTFLCLTASLAVSLNAESGPAAAPQTGAKELFFSASAKVELVAVRADTPKPASIPEPSKVKEKAKTSPSRAPGIVPNPPPNLAPAMDSDYRKVRQRPDSNSVVGLRHWIELVDGGSGETRHVTPDHVFRTGDRIRLHFESTHEGHIRILQANQDRYETLFPAPGQGFYNDLLKAREKRILPGSEAWFRFDHQTGTETLIAIFSLKPSPENGIGAGKENEVRPGRDSPSPPLPVPNRPLPHRQPQGLITSLDRGELDSQLLVQGAKALVLETERGNPNEIGVYAVNLDGHEVILTINLKHE